MPRRITQDDLARATGLSRSTVAKVLSPAAARGELSAATRRTVLEAARRLGYRDDAGRTVVLVGSDGSAWQDPFLPAALAALTGAGLRPLCLPWQGRDTPLPGGAPAAVVAMAFLPDGLAALAETHGLRCLAFNAAGEGATAIRPDEAADMAAAIDHLAGLGHRRLCFAFATGVVPHFSVAERRRAAAAAARRHRLVVEEVVLNHGEDDLLRLMAAADGPSALILAPVEGNPWRVLECRRQRPFALVVVGNDQRHSPITSIQADSAGLAAALVAACTGETAGEALLRGRLMVRETSSERSLLERR
ncbi:MAG: LacI family DNA-binding transcriptional regulator [Planctomycetes bacterium]|nr:LacI family DNA-binding transcriptional regulator [Planctomycetota bacterium]